MQQSLSTTSSKSSRCPGDGRSGSSNPFQLISRTSFLVTLLMLLLLLLLLPGTATFSDAVRLTPRLVNGRRLLDIDGSFLRYYIFAEERAVVNPVPEIEIYDKDGGAIQDLSHMPPAVANPPTPKLVERNCSVVWFNQSIFNGTDNTTMNVTVNETQCTNYTVSRTMSNETGLDNVWHGSKLSWWVKSKPFGALKVLGPRFWPASENRDVFRLTDWTFQSSGEYNIQFNATWGFKSLQFNWTVHVNRQPAFLANGPTPFGYNGSVWDPAPIGIVQTILGQTLATSSVNVSFELQAAPVGTVLTGTTSRFTSTAGVATFPDLIVTLPGLYTYRLTALLSDGSVRVASSVQIEVERALPVRIDRLTSGDGIARFHTFQTLRFLIFDSLGIDFDARLNMTLSLATNSPSYFYKDLESEASIVGIASVKQDVNGYEFSFPGISITLPGTYELSAAIALPGGVGTLRKNFVVTIHDAPRFEFPFALYVNRLGTMTVFGQRPNNYPEILIMLSSTEECDTQASDMITWRVEASAAITERNFSVVPWVAGTLYPCMKIPSQPFFGVMVQNYLPQFDEPYPLIKTVTVAGVTECVQMSNLEALQYNALGWDSAEGGRSYGCALKPPASGTIAPCSCPSHLTCGELRHATFSPAGLNIGNCQCCAGWIMALASLAIAAAFIGLLYVVYEYV